MKLSTAILRSVWASFALAAACGAHAFGQAASTVTQDGVETGQANIRALVNVPAGFDPVKASPEQLERLGFPRKPEAKQGPLAYKRWVDAVSAKRVFAEVKENRDVTHGTMKRPSGFTGEELNLDGKKVANVNSSNWSGYALVGGSPEFDAIEGYWVVPSVDYQFGGDGGYSSEWVGIDGYGSSDVVQAGTEQDSIGGYTNYHAWFEFYPFDYEQAISTSTFPVAPGDAVYVYVSATHSGSYIVGRFYLYNANTHLSVSYTDTRPNWYFQGNSAEWIMERPTVGGYLYDMPNFAYAYMDNGWAFRLGSGSYISFLSEPYQNITMVNGSDTLSTAYSQDSISMWFAWHAYH